MRWKSAAWLSLLFLITAAPGCKADRDAEGDTPGATRCDKDQPCGAGRLCVGRVCVADQGTCRSDNDCINDSYCACPPDIDTEQCVCIPWGMKPRGSSDPTCAGRAFAPEAFENPILKCQWPPAGAPPQGVLTTPLVIDLDKDGQPEIVFHTGVGIAGGGRLIAISGKDCSVKLDVMANSTGCSHLAAADLDGDGLPEIIAQAPGLTVFDSRGNKRASTTGPGIGLCSVDFPPAIANIDGQGPPEIIAGGMVSRFLTNPDRLEVLWRTAANEGSWGAIAVPVDLDGDGVMEVVVGSRVLDGLTGKDKTPTVMKGMGGGYPALGDFNRDGHPDIVLVSSAKPDDMGMGGQTVQIIDYHNNQLLMAPTRARNGWGGPPTVADFDGDGRLDFATASAVSYYVYTPDCLQSPLPARCMGPDEGVLWQSSTQDDSSGSTGSSVFDFNGDGAAEVVYRDECWLRVYSGKSGKTLFAAPVTSGTDLELPVVADTDADGHAEIVVSSTGVGPGFCARSAVELGMKHPGPTSGVHVYMDPRNRWMPSRGIWNQHAYYITNVNDDGTIPLREEANIRTYNNFRANVQGRGGGGMGKGDATGGVVLIPDEGDCMTTWRLHANLCNRGAADFAKGLPGTFYLGDPRAGGRALCTARTTAALPPGQCALLSCEWLMPKSGSADLWFRANDDGQGGRPAIECKEGNGLAHFGTRSCSYVP